MQVVTTDSTKLIDLIHDLCGIYLDESKQYLIDSRFGSLMKKYECNDYNQFVKMAQMARHTTIRDEIVDAITTNETLFFRDNSPYEALRHKILPNLIDQTLDGRRPKRLRIWSAACSTGQEPYSLAMTLRDVVPDVDSWDIEILGTDVSPSALEHAKAGIYTNLEISRGIDAEYQDRYFVRNTHDWEICKSIRKLVRFEKRNLLEAFLEQHYFDIIFCRNVAIYFEKKERDELFRRLADTLTREGVLVVGSAESLRDLADLYSCQIHCNSTLYYPE